MHGMKKQSVFRMWKAYKAKELNESKWLYFPFVFREIATVFQLPCLNFVGIFD